MEIKFELDTDKAVRATVAIAASYGLGRVSEGTECPQLAFANAIALIIIIAILYSTRPAVAKKTTPQEFSFQLSPSSRVNSDFS
jgi:hypothetical protein